MNMLRTRTRPFFWVITSYFTMALSFVMLTSVTAIMFKNFGMANSNAAKYSSMLILAYTLKPFFSPVVEMYKTKKFFVISSQVVLAMGFVAVALTLGLEENLMILLALLWVISFAGAMQDIACDGVYVTALSQRDQAWYCGLQSVSWSIGPIFGSGFLVYLSGRFYSELFHQPPGLYGAAWIGPWRIVFLIVATVVVSAAFWHIKFMPDGGRSQRTPSSFSQAREIVYETFTSFFKKPDVWRIIAFTFFFRLGVGLLEKVGPLFMMDPVAKGGLGITNEQLGITYGTYGLAAVLLGSLLGGLYVARRGLEPTLLILCCAVNIPNATFWLMSIYLPSNLALIAGGVVIEKFFFGFGSVGSIIYLMQQVAPGKYSASHYAIGTGVMALSAMFTGLISGYLQQWIGYKDFFLLVMIAAVPSFMAAWLAPFNVPVHSSAALSFNEPINRHR